MQRKHIKTSGNFSFRAARNTYEAALHIRFSSNAFVTKNLRFFAINTFYRSVDRHKLVLGFTVLVALSVICGVLALQRIHQLSGMTRTLYEHPLTVTRASLEAYAGVIKMHRGMKDVALAKTAEQANAAARAVEQLEPLVLKHLARAEKHIIGAQWQGKVGELRQLFVAWRPIREQVIAKFLANDFEGAAEITKNKGAAHVVALGKQFEDLVAYSSDRADGLYAESRKMAQSSEQMIVVLAGVSVLLGGLIAFFLNKSIVQRISLFRETIGLIEKDADLSRRIDITSEDEIGQAANAFNRMIVKFSTVLRDVNDSASSLASAATRVASVAKECRDNAEAQQEQLEQMATAMNEMASTVNEVAQSAGHAASSATNSTGKAREGQARVAANAEKIAQLSSDVRNASEVIAAVEQESLKIGGVLDVIRGIAEQTNLLALNAAIEAARAGEQGRGFAVVADEVRSLASRTQQSTTEIREMIERLQGSSQSAVRAMQQSCDKASSGVDEIRQTVGTLQEISDDVQHMNDLNVQIATASEEQAAVTEQLNQNVVSIRDNSEQNAAGAQRSEQASAELMQLANELRGLVGQFRL